MRKYVIHLRGVEAVVEFKAKLTNAAGLLKKIGALFVAQSKRAWREQRLGTAIWKERSPAQQDPFINIIPVVFQAGFGNQPVAIDFQRRPALRDRLGVTIAEGVAVRSVSNRSVVVGHNKPWAGIFQYGGIGSVPITSRTREVLWGWLYQKRGVPRKGREEYAKKLNFVFFRDSMTSKAYARPFLGLTDDITDEIRGTIARHVGARAA